jgi:hypothetical protein
MCRSYAILTTNLRTKTKKAALRRPFQEKVSVASSAQRLRKGIVVAPPQSDGPN